jgi:uncharacterized repeat protein (TIGR02543 family)
MRKTVKIILLPVLMFSLGSCAKENTNISPSDSMEMVKVKVIFESNGGNSIAPIELDEGQSLERPASPTKSGYIFIDWYLDSGCTQQVSFPMVIHSDITLYAQYQECRSYYLAARDKTVGQNSKGFEYASNLDVKVGYAGVENTVDGGTYLGKSQYNPGMRASYYEKLIYAGALFKDHTAYEYLEDNSLVSVKVNNDAEVDSYSVKDQDSGYRYDSSSFAKALFTYTNDDIKAIIPAGNDKYEIQSKQSFSSIAKTILSNVNNKYVEMILGKLPETESTYHNYVTFSPDGLIDAYSYSFTVSVSGVTVIFSYSLSFVLANKAPAIAIPSFPGLFTDETTMTSKLADVKNAIDAYKGLPNSAYDFKLKTGVNFAGANDINATIQGKALRVVNEKGVYFKNKIEVDSDLKNDDLYKKNGVVDYKRTRAKLNDGTVYDVKNPPLGKTEYTPVTTSTALDEYYFLIGEQILTASDFSCISENTKEGVVTYTLVLGGNIGISSILSLVNDSVRLDPTLQTHYEVMGNFIPASIATDNGTLAIDLKGDTLFGLRIELEGSMDTSYPDSAGFTTTAKASYSIDLSIKATDDAKAYTIPNDKADID